jgi:phospho-N-acetylmuramoyl-pentapeptide-transferase
MESHLVLIFSFWIATFLVGFLLTPMFIRMLQELKLWKQIRSEATIWKATLFAKLHKAKSGTPTMWWAIILFTVFLMVLLSMVLQWLWFINNSLFNANETYLSLFTLLTVWWLGLIDDFFNIRWIGKTKWLSARVKMIWLTFFATLWAFWFYYKLGWNVVDEMWNFIRTLNNPFWIDLEIWLWFIPLFIFIIIATSNSVNLTDGLDGLAWWLLLFNYGIYTYITYDQGLFLLSALCMSLVWALVAFLWFNVKPAKFYMWDVWSLALGANLWIIAMITNTVFILIIIWAIFIFETLSVIIQLTSKKLRKGKKVFRIAPFHHHLEAIGWSEENVVFRLWLVGMITSVFGIIFYILQK